MYFQHADAIWRDYPELVPGLIHVAGISPDVSTAFQVARYTAVAEGRLAGTSEASLPEIQAWRRTFSQMGLKPTQYRSASESLLRRLRKEGSLPVIHPLIDRCNAVSLAFAIPVAAFDVSRIDEFIEVRYAAGDERYDTFSGEVEQPNPGEVVFVDRAGRAHARRWTNRQSGYSAVGDTTTEALIVAEALHPTAGEDIRRLVDTLAGELAALWPVTPHTAILSQAAPRFDF